MKQFVVKFAALVFVGTLASCASDPNRYQNTPSSKLCLDYLAVPAQNIFGALEGINQRAREIELKRRNESCSAFLGAAQARRDSEIREEQARNELQRRQEQTRQEQTRQDLRSLTCRTTATGGGNSVTNCD